MFRFQFSCWVRSVELRSLFCLNKLGISFWCISSQFYSDYSWIEFPCGLELKFQLLGRLNIVSWCLVSLHLWNFSFHCFELPTARFTPCKSSLDSCKILYAAQSGPNNVASWYFSFLRTLNIAYRVCNLSLAHLQRECSLEVSDKRSWEHYLSGQR